MINIKNTIIAAIAIASISVTTAFAGMSFGVVGSSLDLGASGTETDRLTAAGANVSDASTRTKAISEKATLGTVYLEYTMSESAWPLAFGVEYTPGTADISGQLSRTDTETSVTGDKVAVSNTVIRSASAEATNMSTAYVEAPLFYGLYVKGGLANITVNHTNQSNMEGSSNISGTNYGIGWKTETAGGYIIKASYEETDYSTISLRSINNSVTANSSGVKADVDTEAFRLSVGKAF